MSEICTDRLDFLLVKELIDFLTPEEQTELDAWKNQSETHRTLFNKHQKENKAGFRIIQDIHNTDESLRILRAKLGLPPM